MTIFLHDTLNPISRDERIKINENWQSIIKGLTSLQLQIKFLAGGVEVDELIENITTATTEANQTIDEMNGLISDASNKLDEIDLAITNANEATDNAVSIHTVLTTLKGQLETLQTDLSNIVQAEIHRVSNEETRIDAEVVRENNEDLREQNEDVRINNELTREQAEQNRTTSFNSKMITADEKINAIGELIDGLESFSFDVNDTYDFPNLVAYNGSTFMALKEVTGITPIDDGVNYRLVAQRGVDGTGSVSSVNGKFPDVNGNVEITVDSIQVVDSLNSTSTTAALSANKGKDLNERLTVVENDGINLDDIPLASLTQDGFMSKSDKLKLNGISSGANFVQVEDSLTSTSPTSALSANKGKEISDKIDTLSGEVEAIDNNLIALQNEVTTHLDEKNNPHDVTAEQLGAVKKTGDTMTGALTVPRIILANGTQIRDMPNERTVLNTHNNRFDAISQDGQKYLFRYMNGDFSVFDENGTLIDSFKSLKQKIGVYETGVWTPILRGSTTAGTPVYVSREGEYIRQNNLLYVRCRILLSSKGGMAGNLEITGLPIVAKGAYRVATIGVHHQVTYPANAKDMAGYIDSNIMRPYFNITGTGNELLRVTANDVSDAFLITFTATYDI